MGTKGVLLGLCLWVVYPLQAQHHTSDLQRNINYHLPLVVPEQERLAVLREQLMGDIKRMSHAEVMERMYTLLEVDYATALTVPLIPPLARWSRNRISSRYGWRWHPVKGGYRFHAGIDLAGPPQIVRAAGVGWVRKTGYDPGLGNFVEVDHMNSYTTVYGHLSLILCQPGQFLPLDTNIGVLGRTGTVTGYHLHFTVKKNGVNIDPAPYLILGLKLVDAYKRNHPDLLTNDSGR